MNRMFINLVPPWDFEQIGGKTADWENSFLELVSERKNIQYDSSVMPALSANIQNALASKSYCEYVLVPNTNIHFFFVPAQPQESTRPRQSSTV